MAEETQRADMDSSPVDFKYIDDLINLTTVNMRTVAMYEQDDVQIKKAHPVQAEAALHHVTNKAALKGMVVIRLKTSLACITAATSYRASAKIKDKDGQEIISGQSAMFLGVTLDRDCSFKSHIDNIRKKIRARSWTLCALKRAGFNEQELIKTYCIYVHPLAEYSSTAWGSMITQEQSDTLERQQCQALKNIYGLGISGRKMRTKAGLDSLSERRQKALEKFEDKNVGSERFGSWFTERPEKQYGLRRRNG